MKKHANPSRRRPPISFQAGFAAYERSHRLPAHVRRAAQRSHDAGDSVDDTRDRPPTMAQQRGVFDPSLMAIMQQLKDQDSER